MNEVWIGYERIPYHDPEVYCVTEEATEAMLIIDDIESLRSESRLIWQLEEDSYEAYGTSSYVVKKVTMNERISLK